jgi:hypothetical protein
MGVLRVRLAAAGAAAAPHSREACRTLNSHWTTLCFWRYPCLLTPCLLLLLLLLLLLECASGFSPESFLTLDDSLLGEIKRAARRNPQCPHLRAAAAILRRLDSRDLYLWVAEVTVPEQVRMVRVVLLFLLSCDN